VAHALDYDVIIATRNRPDVLRLSIPTFLGQSRPPSAIVVVDSSDDHDPVLASVEAATGVSGQASNADGIRVECHHAAPGLTAQRNIGLARIESPVVMFPDDDSIWFDGTAQAVMQVYERDEAGIIGGVTMRQMRSAPPGVLDSDEGRDRRNLSEKLIYRFSPWRVALENLVTPNPMERLGEDLVGAHGVPEWLADAGATPVGYMHGYRMTFRTEAIRGSGGFDETLGAYGLYEDFEASMRVASGWVLAMAQCARVYHHRAPGSRANGLTTGVMLMLNLAYVVCRHSDPGSMHRAMVRRYGRMRLMQYRLRSRGEFGRARLDGFRRAMGHLGEMLDAPRDAQPGIYARALEACLAE